MDADRTAIGQFIEWVHGPEPPRWLMLWALQNKATRGFNFTEAGLSITTVARANNVVENGPVTRRLVPLPQIDSCSVGLFSGGDAQ